jgi:hypothetical protein
MLEVAVDEDEIEALSLLCGMLFLWKSGRRSELRFAADGLLNGFGLDLVYLVASGMEGIWNDMVD